MPNRFPFYEAPSFLPTGNAETDKALEQWRQDYSNVYARNLFENERLPAIHSTFSTATFSLTTVSWGTTLVSLAVGFQGGEQVTVIGSVTGNVEGIAGLSFVTYTLFVRTPNGDVLELSSRIGNMGANTTAGLFGTITQMWRVEPVIQTGGLHTFALRAHEGGNSSNNIEDPGLVVQVF